ncbi:MAG: Ger(x)C family spore germination protein [Bacillota bacterium]|nr:Ger(x)C family spore germination protein [Bacillota bacterium]
MKKAVLVILLLGSMLLVTGCWSWVEIENRAIVSALGVDKAAEGERLEVTVQIIKPGEIQSGAQGGGISPAVAVYSDSGYDLADALRNLGRQVGRKLTFSKLTVLVIGEGIAGEGTGSIMDFIFRHYEPDLRVKVIVVRGRAKEVLETEIPTDKVWGLGLDKLVEATRLHARAPAVSVLDFLKAVSSKTTSPVATGMEMAGEKKKPAEEEVAPGKKPVVTGTAVFKDYKLTGWLDETETRGLLWIKGEVEGGVIVIPSPGNQSRLMALEITYARSKIEPQIKDGRIIVTVKISEEGNIGEVEPDNVEIDKPGTLEIIEARKKKVIEKEVLAAIARAQELNADVFGFGEAVRRKYPRKWPQYEKKWEELFPLLDIRVEVEAKIRRVGLIKKPIIPGS